MNIKILDTTLRDGEQTPGVSLTSLEKLRIATKLDEILLRQVQQLLQKGKDSLLKI